MITSIFLAVLLECSYLITGKIWLIVLSVPLWLIAIGYHGVVLNRLERLEKKLELKEGEQNDIYTG